MRQQDNVVVKQSVTVVAVNAPRKEQRMQSLYDILCRAEQIMAEDSPSDLDLSEFFAEFPTRPVLVASNLWIPLIRSSFTAGVVPRRVPRRRT
jgi:hypothetical protein